MKSNKKCCFYHSVIIIAQYDLTRQTINMMTRVSDAVR